MLKGHGIPPGDDQDEEGVGANAWGLSAGQGVGIQSFGQLTDINHANLHAVVGLDGRSWIKARLLRARTF